MALLWKVGLLPHSTLSLCSLSCLCFLRVQLLAPPPLS
jgi:hypothetical protein